MNEQDSAASSKLIDQIVALVKRVNTDKPTSQDIETLHKLLALEPELFKEWGDLAVQAKNALIASVPSTVFSREVMKHEMTQLALELAGPEAPTVVRITAEHVALCWADIYLAQLIFTSLQKTGVDIETADYWQRRLSSLQKCYLRAIETLTRVCRLTQTPMIQVNIAERQVNVVKVSTNKVQG